MGAFAGLLAPLTSPPAYRPPPLHQWRGGIDGFIIAPLTSPPAYRPPPLHQWRWGIDEFIISLAMMFQWKKEMR